MTTEPSPPRRCVARDAPEMGATWCGGVYAYASPLASTRAARLAPGGAWSIAPGEARRAADDPRVCAACASAMRATLAEEGAP